MKKLLLPALLAFTLGCSKPALEVPPLQDCESKKYALVTVSNTSNNPYNLYVDEIFTRKIEGKAIVNDIQIKEGNGHKLRVEQISGYLAYPTIKTSELNIVRCTNYSWVIP